MKIKSCFSEHAVQIVCTGVNATAVAPPAADATSALPAAPPCAWSMSSVTTVYRARLSASAKNLLIHVTWSLHGPALSVAVYDAAAASSSTTAGPRRLHETKGSDTFTSGRVGVGVFWDYASARYDGAGLPEPASGFYVAVVANAELVLLLGDMSRGYVDRLHAWIPNAAGSSRVARRHERFVVGACGRWTTRARFSESGQEHEIGVALEQKEAWVSVDGRKVVRVQRLQYNFRGTSTFFLDGGAPVDMTWDLHGWLFHDDDDDPSAIFTFHARSASERTMAWLTDDDGPSGQGRFCLLIQAFRNIAATTTTTYLCCFFLLFCFACMHGPILRGTPC